MEDISDINEQLIEGIRDYIYQKTGKRYFKYIRHTGDNIMVTCPFHKGGQENKPSANIRVTENDRSYIGLFSCFTCHETMALSKVIESLLGEFYNEDEVETLFGLNSMTARSFLKESTNKIQFNITKTEYIPDKDIKYYKKYCNYLADRGINKVTAEKYDLGFDEYNNQVVFPIYTREHRCIGLGRRSIIQKIYRYPYSMIKPLYGIYELDRFIRYLWIGEGPFNIWSLSQWGKQAVGMLGTGTEYQYKQLLTIECKGYICSLDNDEAGIKGTKRLINYLLENHKTNIYVALYPEDKDVNDLTQDEFKQIPILTYKEWLKWVENK